MSSKTKNIKEKLIEMKKGPFDRTDKFRFSEKVTSKLRGRFLWPSQNI